MNRFFMSLRQLGWIAAVAAVLCAISPVASADSLSIPFVQFQGPIAGQLQTFGGLIDLNPTTPFLTLTGANLISGDLSSPCTLLSCVLTANFKGYGAYAGYNETVTVSLFWGRLQTNLSWVAVPEEATIFEVAAILLMMFLIYRTRLLRRPFSV